LRTALGGVEGANLELMDGRLVVEGRVGASPRAVLGLGADGGVLAADLSDGRRPCVVCGAVHAGDVPADNALTALQRGVVGDLCRQWLRSNQGPRRAVRCLEEAGEGSPDRE
jgi:hypothetical protein